MGFDAAGATGAGLAAAFAPVHAAAEAGPSGWSGATATIAWALPFAGLLLTIAVAPLVSEAFWHRHYGKLAFAWTLALLIPFALTFGPGEAAHHVAHALIL